MGALWWDDEYDVVVMGGGGAGLMASVEAAELGARVLLVEKQPAIGGATGMAVGSITAAGTSLQSAAGIQDDTDAHFRDLLTILGSEGDSESYDLELSRLMVELAPQSVERLKSVGVQFSGPHPELPHSVYRMHNAVPGSSAYIAVLKRAAAERGVVIRTEAAVEELRRDARGIVSAVGLQRLGESGTSVVRVRKGVVLAAGDFSGNDDLARRHGRSPEVSAVDPLRPHATGDGILVATAAGAATAGMHRSGYPNLRTALAPHCSPNRGLLLQGAILINALGRRFTDELGDAVTQTNRQPGKVAFVVFDRRLADRVATAEDDRGASRDGWYRQGKLYLSTFPGVGYAYLDDLRHKTEYFFEANSAKELAVQMELPPESLEAELRLFNQVADGKAEDPFGRRSVGPGVSEPPFFAIGPIKPILEFSGGGLKVDRDMHVLDGAGNVIPHLYACGANGESGVFVGGHGHHLAWAFGSGMVAGRNVAAEAPIG